MVLCCKKSQQRKIKLQINIRNDLLMDLFKINQLILIFHLLQVLLFLCLLVFLFLCRKTFYNTNPLLLK